MRGMIRYLITDGTWSANPERWMKHAQRWIAEGVELFQIREKDLSTRDLATLTRSVLALPNPKQTKIIVNDRNDVAIACGAHGVHLRDGSPVPKTFARPGFLITAACHNPAQVQEYEGADYVVLAPIFKPLSKNDDRAPLGASAIADFVRRSRLPVLALGGVTRANARACLDAGAAGVAGITYFEQ